MGLLSVGTPLEWKDAKKHSDHVRRHGIEVPNPSAEADECADPVLAIFEYLEGCKGEGEGCFALGG
jgi:hypothetical protein